MNAGALLTAAALVLVPGIGAMLASYPPARAGLATRLALAFALGYATAGLTATALVIAHVLSRASFIAALVAVTLVLWTVALRRGRPGEHLRALADELRADRVMLAVGLVAMLAIAVVRLRSSPLLDFQEFGPWRYWADGLELADAGRVPSHSLQWGALYTPATSKIVLSSFHAGASYVLGRAPLPAMGALLWVTSMGFACALWALGRELGLRVLAPMLPLLTLAVLHDELRRNLDVYTAENVGRMVAAAGLVVGVRALRDRGGWLEPALAALLFGTGFATHGVPVVALMIALGWYGVARILLDGHRRRTLARMTAIAGAAPALSVALLLSAGGTIGFQGAAGSDQYAAFGANVDPTASLLAGAAVRASSGTGHWFVPPTSILDAFAASGTMLSDPPRIVLAALAVAVAVAVVGLARLFPDDLGPAAVLVAGLGISLLAVAFVFSYRYRTQIPGRFGVDREFDYLPLAAMLLALCVAEAVLRRLERLWRWGPALAAAALVAAPAVAVAATAGPARSGYRANGIGALRVLDWVTANVPCNARILPDRVTLGTFAAATGRVSVMEGMGPYLRPEMLRPVLADVLAAHRFFEHPGGGQAFLRREGVDYVVVLTGQRIGSMVGTLAHRRNPGAFAQAPFLRRVYMSPEFEVYRVRGSGQSAGRFPSPADAPGYTCIHGPVADGS